MQVYYKGELIGYAEDEAAGNVLIAQAEEAERKEEADWLALAPFGA